MKKFIAGLTLVAAFLVVGPTAYASSGDRTPLGFMHEIGIQSDNTKEASDAAAWIFNHHDDVRAFVMKVWREKVFGGA